MGEFAGMEDWSLQAVVGGCTNYFTNTLMDNCFGPLDIQNDGDLHLFETTSTFLGDNELEQLYKPFYPIFHTLPSETLITPSCSSSSSISAPKEEHPEEKVSTPTTPAPKYKRRKNQQKRVVLQVTSEGVISSDMWAWRKYGQKPIKGSPYPRSYYRCSSSKGCLARKQVEQSCTDPGMFIITYTAEHSHSQPTRRNSLAGTNRNKFSSARSPTTSGCSPSPPAPLEVPQQTIKEETTPDDEQEKLMVEESNDGEFVIPDMMLGDDFFAGLEDLDELSSDTAFYGWSTNQFPVTFCS